MRPSEQERVSCQFHLFLRPVGLLNVGLGVAVVAVVSVLEFVLRSLVTTRVEGSFWFVEALNLC